MSEREKKYESLIGYCENIRQSFDELPFGEIDALILTQLAYIRFENIVPANSVIASPIAVSSLLKAELFDKMLSGHSLDRERRALLIAFAMSPRYRGTKLNHYINIVDKDKMKQFSAVTFLLDDRSVFVAFRGTDNTLVGWRENFNMVFTCPVPAQLAAIDYLNKAAGLNFRPIRVGGHSKGGNLAVFAAMGCEPAVRKRILDVYSHDGPGFMMQISNSPEFLSIKGRLHKIMPEASIVGTLLEQSDYYKVVSSSADGIDQHDAFTWEIDGNDFNYLDSLSSGSRRFDFAVDSWIESMDDETRRRMVELIFHILEQTGSTTMSGAEQAFRAAGLGIQKFMKDIDSESRRYLFGMFLSFGKSYLKAFSIGDRRGKDDDDGDED